jgi:hypothetical protein
MYSRSLKLRYTLAALLAFVCAPVTNASAVVVQFSATIFQSPFSSGELAIGGTIAGQYSYDPTTSPFETGPNFARYNLLGDSFSAGAKSWTSLLPQLHLADNIGISLANGTFYPSSDVYSVIGFTLLGPSIGGFTPGSAALDLVDADNAIYTGSELPIALPDPGLFEANQFHFVLFNERFERADVAAGVNSISVVSEPSSLALLGAMGPLVLLIVLRKRWVSGRRES